MRPQRLSAGFSVLQLLLGLSIMMGILYSLESLWSFLLKGQAEIHQKEQVFLRARALSALLQNDLNFHVFLPKGSVEMNHSLSVQTSFFQDRGLDPTQVVQVLNPSLLHMMGAQVLPNPSTRVLSTISILSCYQALSMIKAKNSLILDWVGEPLVLGDLLSLQGRNHKILTQVSVGSGSGQVIHLSSIWSEQDPPLICQLRWRAFYQTQQGHLAILEASGRSELWWDDLMIWQPQEKEGGVLLSFAFVGERGTHELWLL